MSVIMDFSLSNPLISEYFKGSDKYVPISELLYVHSHPLVNPNFLSQIEKQVNETAMYMMAQNMKNGPVKKFLKLGENLGRLLPRLTKDNASEALSVLRELHQLCNSITVKQ